MVSKFSVLKSNPLSSSLSEIEFSQFKRTYSGNYTFNFPLILSGCNDFSVKNYSNFYLTDNRKITDSIRTPSDRIKSKGIQSTLRFGDDYLAFAEIDPIPYALEGRNFEINNYGACNFQDFPDEFTDFNIEIDNNNVCHIIYWKNFVPYYLASDEKNQLFFAKKSILNFSRDTTNSQDFKYILSDDRNFLFIFQSKATGDYQVVKDGDNLVLSPVLSADVSSNLGGYFRLSRGFYTSPSPNLNTSFITYDSSNMIDEDRSVFDMKNNLLLHRPYSFNTSTDIIVLKNQLPQNDIFMTGNNLISSNIPVGNFRNYTSIFDSVNTEKTDTLELNYVFYNKVYNIVPGSNEFTAPSSLFPFERLNINDTHFIKSGSFSFNSPELADKVYQLDDEMNNIINGQEYLCTWLSGHPLSKEKVWIDRYYYPDLITKEEALMGNNSFNVTYDDILEQMIQNNTQLKGNITSRKIFDKKSDLCFQPNKRYRYERLNIDQIKNAPTISKICDCGGNDVISTNYFKDLNKLGKFTVGFYFIGDDKDWVVESNRNNINGGVRFIKSGENLIYELNLYDPSNGGYTLYSFTKPYSSLKENFTFVSIDVMKGLCYFYLNNEIVYRLSFPVAQFYGKNILFGDFYLTSQDRPIDRYDIFTVHGQIYDSILIKDYMDEDFAFYLQLSRGNFEIQAIQISLPCGMRNSTDHIDILNSICSSSIFKSSNFNVRIKNIPLDKTEITDTVKTTVKNNIVKMIPITSDLNNLEFDSFK